MASNMTTTAQQRYTKQRINHWNHVARKMDHWSGMGGYYLQRLQEIYRFVVPEGSRVLEVGCGYGDLLASLKPDFGVGIDFSSETIHRASLRHPGLHFIRTDAHALPFRKDFDFIILSDVVNDLWDVQAVFKEIFQIASGRTRLVMNTYSRLWEFPLWLAKKMNLAKPALFQNWLTVEDIAGLLRVSGFEMIRNWDEVLWPIATPLLSSLLNRYAAKMWPGQIFDLTHFIVARPVKVAFGGNGTVSVVVPARNEAGNVENIFRRVPDIGKMTELVFVEGHSSDGTYEAIEKAIGNHPERRCKLMRQTGSGKGDAVRMGFDHASGDVLMILDADLTVPPEDLPRFYDLLSEGKGEFVNGVRLIYPMEKEAMRFFNLVGNKFFSLAFSWLLGQPIKDTLCGTKVLWKVDYEKIKANRSYFGDFDPFGDFDLLFGAAKLNLKIVEMPIRYREREYGSTNISRWRHGWLLLRMVAFATRRMKFI
jgi:ubiquinone/menaquinone biosynthesis C-methylase UbiE